LLAAYVSLVFLKRIYIMYPNKNGGDNFNKSTKTLMVKVRVNIFFHTNINIILVNLYCIIVLLIINYPSIHMH